MMIDTKPEAAEAQLRALRAMPAARRLALAVGWSRSVRAMSWESLKRQFPDCSQVEVRRVMADRLLGEALAARVYGPVIPHG